MTIDMVSPPHVSPVIELPYDSLSAREARTWARFVLDIYGMDPCIGEIPADTVDTVELIVSELVTNSLTHTATMPHKTITCSLHCTPQGDANLITLYVMDAGAKTAPHAQSVDTCQTNGRGLHIVEALSDSWGHRKMINKTGYTWVSLKVERTSQ